MIAICGRCKKIIGCTNADIDQEMTYCKDCMTEYDCSKEPEKKEKISKTAICGDCAKVLSKTPLNK